MADQDDRELSGLQYLSRERPEAMQHLLAFFKESSEGCLPPPLKSHASTKAPIVGSKADRVAEDQKDKSVNSKNRCRSRTKGRLIGC